MEKSEEKKASGKIENKKFLKKKEPKDVNPSGSAVGHPHQSHKRTSISPVIV